MLRKLLAVFGFASLAWLTSTPVSASEWDKKTTVKFTQPVELPNTVLPAGTYVFKLLDSPQNRHVVQVFNEAENHLFATVLAIPNARLTRTSETVMRFNEARRDKPEPLRAWFYPADSWGHEFVYPKTRALEIAVATHTPVLTAPVTPAETPEVLVKEPVIAVTPEKKEVELAQVVTPAPVTPPPVIAQAAPPAPAAAPAPELPKTAGPLPLMALAAVCLSAAAAGVHFRRKRVS